MNRLSTLISFWKLDPSPFQWPPHPQMFAHFLYLLYWYFDKHSCNGQFWMLSPRKACSGLLFSWCMTGIRLVVRISHFSSEELHAAWPVNRESLQPITWSVVVALMAWRGRFGSVRTIRLRIQVLLAQYDRLLMRGLSLFITIWMLDISKWKYSSWSA